MLTTRDLAVLGAALAFFDEEMFPDDSGVTLHYMPEGEGKPTRDEVRRLRAALPTASIRYVRFDPATGAVGGELFEDPAGAGEGPVAAVILPTDA